MKKLVVDGMIIDLDTGEVLSKHVQETQKIRFGYRSKYEPSNICVWIRLRAHRRWLRSLGFSGRLKNLYKLHTETKYANLPGYPIYMRMEKSRRKR